MDAGNGLGRGTLPRGSGRPCGSGGEQDQAVAIEVGGRQRQLDPGCQLGDPGGHLDERQAKRVELGLVSERALGRQSTLEYNRHHSATANLSTA